MPRCKTTSFGGHFMPKVASAGHRRTAAAICQRVCTAPRDRSHSSSSGFQLEQKTNHDKQPSHPCTAKDAFDAPEGHSYRSQAPQAQLSENHCSTCHCSFAIKEDMMHITLGSRPLIHLHIHTEPQEKHAKAPRHASESLDPHRSCSAVGRRLALSPQPRTRFQDPLQHFLYVVLPGTPILCNTFYTLCCP